MSEEKPTVEETTQTAPPQEEKEKEMTPEELEQARKDMEAFYEEQIPFLEKQAKYEKLIAEIEESRFIQLSSRIRIANIIAPQGKKTASPNPTPQA